MQEELCPLCKSESHFHYTDHKRKKNYFACLTCHLVFLSPSCFLSPEEEKKIYLQHENDIHDQGYQNFVSPLIDFVSENFSPDHRGLDFGSGTGPVTSFLLHQKGYQVNQYDPFFFKKEENLNLDYDFIVSCEVVEHFHYPAKEFERLRKLLRPNGPLILSTSLYSQDIHFESWYYHRDPTHVLFYQLETFEWIRENFNFKSVKKLSNRLVILGT